jgi:hypothetical protein
MEGHRPKEKHGKIDRDTAVIWEIFSSKGKKCDTVTSFPI